MIRRARWVLLVLVGLGPAGTGAEPIAPETLKQLLEQTQNAGRQAQQVYAERESRFLAALEHQRGMLAEERARVARLTEQMHVLQAEYEDRAARLDRTRDRLELGDSTLTRLTEWFEQSVAAVEADFEQSTVTAEFPGRIATVQGLRGAVTAVPTIEQLETLWLELLRSMIADAEVNRFAAPVVSGDGSVQTREVWRVGPFMAAAGPNLLRWNAAMGQLEESPWQPRGKNRRMLEAFAASSVAEAINVPVDPTSGRLLEVMAKRPTIVQRVEQGRSTGYLILALGGIGIAVGLYRIGVQLRVARRVRSQLRKVEQPAKDNPLGRVILAATGKTDGGTKDNAEQLQSKLDEAICREVPQLEKGCKVLKLLAAVSPMLGLLGTIIGLIATFQGMGAFGGVDPAVMASGIAQALVTTLLGLVVAVPLLFMHAFLSAGAGAMVQTLEERSAGLLASSLSKVPAQHDPGVD